LAPAQAGGLRLPLRWTPMPDEKRDPRLTEQRNPRSARIDQMDTLAIVDLMNAEDRLVAPAVGTQREQIARAIDLIVEALNRGARTGFLLCTPPSPQLLREHDVVIAPLVGPEVVTGSTRMKAGTATKMVLNMLSTAAMVQTGKVYGNLMVDLQVTCQKLQDRG